MPYDTAQSDTSQYDSVVGKHRKIVCETESVPPSQWQTLTPKGHAYFTKINIEEIHPLLE